MSLSYTVIVPALNEEAGIGAVIDRLLALSPKPEVVIVDDGSMDGTGAIARERGVTVVTHPIPGGYGKAIKAGTKRASNDIIVITDADGTYPIEEIPRLLSTFERGFDMVVGARRGKYYRGSLLKMPARILLKWLVEFTTGRLIPDINSGLRVFRKSDVLAIENDLCNGFSFTTTITLVYMLSGKFVGYEPIDYFARIGSSKVRIIRDSLRTLQYITEAILSYNPLKLFVLMSGCIGLLGLLLLAAGELFYSEWSILAGIGAVGTSFIVFAIGLLTTSLFRKKAW